MPVGDLPGWKQVFTEDFTSGASLGSFPGSVYGSKFSVYADGTPDTAGQQGKPSRYEPSQVVSVANGMLNLYLHTANGTPMAAAIMPTLPKSMLYGKYTIRFKSDSLQGFKTAWMLWPDSENWPQDGEIDFPEGDLSSTIGGYVHHQNATSGSDQDAYSTKVTYTSWHTASIEWSPGKVTFILDGATVGTSTTNVPNTPMHWVIQTESCLDGCPAASTAGNLQIDWITAYTYNPTS
jgi:beta-glucanase (GH16 family)